MSALFEQQIKEQNWMMFEKQLDEQSDMEEERKPKMKCGKWYTWTEGVLKEGNEKFVGSGFLYHCGHCSECYEREAKEDQLNFNIAISEKGHLKGGLITKSEATKIIQILGGKEKVKKYPQGVNSEGEMTYWVMTEFDYDQVAQENVGLARRIRGWKTYFESPSKEELASIIEKSKSQKGFRESGSLDKKHTKKENSQPIEENESSEDEKSYSLTWKVLRFENAEGKSPTEAEKRLAFRLATSKTAYLDPKTAEEQQQAYTERMKIYTEILESEGYFIVFQSKRTSIIQESDLGWDMEYAQKITPYYSYFLDDIGKAFHQLRNGGLKLPPQH